MSGYLCTIPASSHTRNKSYSVNTSFMIYINSVVLITVSVPLLEYYDDGPIWSIIDRKRAGYEHTNT